MIKYKINKGDSQKLILFVNGSGGDINIYDPVVIHLRNKGFTYDICSFSYTHDFESDEFTFESLTQDLLELLDKLSKTYKHIELVATSMGAYPTCFVLTDKVLSKNIKLVQFIDPADYYINQTKPYKYTWSGEDTYNPNGKTLINLLKDL